MGDREYQAKRLKTVPLSGIRRIMAEAEKLERTGASIIHLEIGRPDFDTPVHIKEAAKAALDRGDVHYTPNLGTLQLRKAISKRAKNELGIEYDAETEVLVTVGASEAVFLSAAAFLDPDDEMLVPDLGWVNYYSVPGLVSCRMSSYRVRQKDAFRPDPAEVAAAVTSRTKLMVLCSPGNPTGAVATREALEGIADVAIRNDLLVMSDEIYDKLVYDGAEHVSLASMPGMRERTIIVNGFSKTYSMTGWRLGYTLAPRDLTAAMVKVHQNLTTCAVSFAQAGAVAALEGSQLCVTEMVSEFKRRRDMLMGELAKMPGITCATPGGAFYVFPDIRAFGISSEEMAMYLLKQAGIAIVPGTSFGPAGEGFIRISYANSYDQIEQAMRRMAGALAKLPRSS